MLTGPQLLKRLWAGAGLWFGLSWLEVSCTTVETWREPWIVEKHGGGLLEYGRDAVETRSRDQLS